ncbi:hypothetical protein PV10_02244 [Exophiala mesophila]|uniref:Uncharacterized protein n=1 Tax=Exophiala mesophila TaxID=212818 RepID=A0A0D1ZKR3_EXOME|nr:uncharacterized protein PV10_02244 [Exophiala mesophila]KIV94479.1 hypothetical protein PV10_02244 [Exophiala mesophila]
MTKLVRFLYANRYFNILRPRPLSAGQASLAPKHKAMDRPGGGGPLQGWVYIVSHDLDKLVSNCFEISEHIRTGQMADIFSTLTLDQRKWHIKDILTTFVRRELGAEFRPDIDRIITEEQQHRPSSEWTIQEDLFGTLFVWGCHDQDGWNFLNRLQSSVERVRHFGEKLQRRFGEIFENYDAAQFGSVVERHPVYERERRPGLEPVVESLQHLVKIAVEDFHLRSEGEEEVVSSLLTALGWACERISPLNDPSQVLVEFLLSALESIKTQEPSTFQSDKVRQRVDAVSMRLPREIGQLGAFRRRVGQL